MGVSGTEVEEMLCMMGVVLGSVLGLHNFNVIIERRNERRSIFDTNSQCITTLVAGAEYRARMLTVTACNSVDIDPEPLITLLVMISPLNPSQAQSNQTP